MATIAGLPKAPSSLNPISNPERSKDRRHLVLDRMYSLGYITKEEYEKAVRISEALFRGNFNDLSNEELGEAFKGNEVKEIEQRASMYFYNTKEDIDKLVEKLDNDNILYESL